MLGLVENIDKESRNEGQAGACAVHAGIQAGGRAVGARGPGHWGGKVLGISKASLGSWVRAEAKGELSGVSGDDKVAKVSHVQMGIARLRAEVARLRVERDIAKKATAYSLRTRCEVRLDTANEA